MSKKELTTTIKIKAEFEQAGELGKWIAGIKSEAAKAGNEALVGWIQDYENRLKALMTMMADFDASPSEAKMSAMHDEMKQMHSLGKKIASTFSSITLDPEISKKLEELAQKEQELKRTAKNTRNTKKRWESKITEGSLSDAELKRIYLAREKEGSPIKVGDKTYGGEGGLNFETFKTDFRANTADFMAADKKLGEAITERLETIYKNINDSTIQLNSVTSELARTRTEVTALKSSSPDTAPAVEGYTRAGSLATSIEDTDSAIKAEIKARKAEEEAAKKAEKAKKDAAKATVDFNEETKKTPSLVQRAATQVFTYGSLISTFRTLVSNAKRTITELDDALTNMAIVTSMTRQEAWKLVGAMQDLAKQTGATTTEVAGVITKFLQQGKSYTQATQLAEAALKGAKIAGIDSARSVDLLTNAMNGFQMAANQAMEVSDKFAALAAASATDYEELAVALSKVAAQANLAGMSMDFTLGMLAKGVEVTREAPETIGTALKTVISRMRELTDYGETLEEGMDINRVETALKNVGVELRNEAGQFRDLESVLTELGTKWDELNVNQQANVAVALAGTRQQSRLIAMMQDFDRTLELVDISTNSYGATMAQHMEYMEGLQAATDRLTTSYEGLITSVTGSDFIINIVNILARAVEMADWVLNDAHMLVPVLVTMGIVAANILANKIEEYRISQLNTQLEQKQASIERQAWLARYKASAKEIKATIKQEILDKKNLLTLKAKTLEEQKQAILSDDTLDEATKNAKIIALEAEYKAEEGKITTEILEKEQELLNVDREKAMYQQVASMEANYQLQSYGLLGTIMNTVLAPIQMMASVAGVVNTLLSASIALRKKEGSEIDKNSRKTLKAAVSEKIKAAWGMAGSASSIPVAGWVIAGVILATILGLTIAAGVATSNAAEKNQKSVEGNIKAMQNLQGEIYNLGQQAQTISKIGDEFELLSGKINKTAEDVARLEELITEFNDSVGYEMIAPGSSAEYALNMMRGEEYRVQKQMEEKIQESNKMLASNIASGFALTRYMNNAAGKAVLKQNLAQNYQDFGVASDNTQELILSAIKNNSSAFITSGGGLNYTAIENAFSAADMASMDEAIATGSATAYAKALDNMSNSAKRFISQSDSLFGVLTTYNSEAQKIVAKQIDAMGLSAEKLAELSPLISKNIHLFETEGKSGTELLGDLLENRLSPEQAEANLKSAESARDTWWKQNGDRITKLRNQKAKRNDGMLNKQKEAELKKLEEELAGLSGAVSNAEQDVDIANMSKRELYNYYDTIKSITDLQDKITKSQSTTEKFAKAIAGELDPKDMDELMGAYPKLVGFMKDGVLTAEEAKQLRQDTYDLTLKELEAEKEAEDVRAREYAQEEGWDWDKVKNMSYETLTALYDYETEEGKLIIDTWSNYWQKAMKVDDFAKSGALSEKSAEIIGKSNGVALAKAQYEAYKEKMELYSVEDKMYELYAEKAIQSAVQATENSFEELAKIKSDIDKTMGDIGYEILNGEVFYKDEGGMLHALSTLEKEIADQFGTLLDSGLVEKYAEAEEVMLEDAKVASELYLDIKTQEVEKEKELIEARKENYEEYFEAIDALEEEQERTQSREEIIKQLSALSTGIDGTSKSKIKDLQQQLRDLADEEKEAQKEAVRNALLENLDNQTEQLDNSIQNLENTMQVLIRTLVGQGDEGISAFSIKTGESFEQALQRWLEENGMGFAHGGKVSYTGLAAVHGSPSRPEGFLSADDTELLTFVLNGLHSVFERTEVGTDIENNTNSVSIEAINIHTDSLNNNQDFRSAGTLLAQEFAKIINERGLNVNTKK